jgi:hypothetical protein
VGANAEGTEEKLFGNLFVIIALREQVEHFQLTL